MKIRIYQTSDQSQVLELWKQCELLVPHIDPIKDINRKTSHSPELFFVGTESDQIISSAMAGYDGHRGMVNYLAVHPSFQNKGIGREMMDYLETKLRQLGCAKINLYVRTSNLKAVGFYENLGFKTDSVISLGKRLEFDNVDDTKD